MRPGFHYGARSAVDQVGLHNIEFKPLPMHSLEAQSLDANRFDFVLLNMMYHDDERISDQ